MLKFNKKYEYDEYMDPEVVDLCNAMNALPGIETFESCCGHNDDQFRIWFKVKNSKQGLFFITRCANSRYWEYGHIWKIELIVGDMNYEQLPVHYYLHSGEVKGKEAYKQAKSLVDNMNHHLNHENFLKYYKIDLNKFDI